MATETKTFYPGRPEDTYNQNGSWVESALANVVGKGSSNTSSVYLSVANKNGGYAHWPFDVSTIPSNAVIDSVSCKVKANVSDEDNTVTATLQLYAGTVAKGTATTFSDKTSASVYSISAGTWTRSELNSIRLRTTVKSSTSSTYNLYFYGSDLAVTYTYQSEKFMLKLGGVYNDVTRVFKKVNGVYIEQTDLANVIEDGVGYVNGGEYIAPVTSATVTITGAGDATYCYATINGQKYNGAASNIKVMPGDVITFGVYGRSSTYYGRVTIDGTQALNVTNQQTQTYNWTVPDGVKTISIAMTYTSSSYQRNGRIVVTTS